MNKINPAALMLWLIASTMLVTCVSTTCSRPVPEPPVDASPTFEASPHFTACGIACANLRLLGCSEGEQDNCEPVCIHAQEAGLTDLKPDCLSAARTKDAARACKTVKCP